MNKILAATALGSGIGVLPASADSYWPSAGQLPGWPVPKAETLAQAMCHRMIVEQLAEPT